MSRKRGYEASSSEPSQVNYYTSTPIHDRSSTFLAVFSSSPSALSNPSQLQSHSSFLDATHRMLAWRRPSRQRALPFTSSNQPPTTTKCETGSDEDGESYAGRKLEALLEREGVVGAVCVGRWYGGVMLGPVRFKWIEDVAREAIRKGMRGDDSTSSRGNDAKKTKVDDGEAVEKNDEVDETQEKERLAKILTDRDASIDVLRTLLAEKNAELEVTATTMAGGVRDGSERDGQTQVQGDHSGETGNAPDRSGETRSTKTTAIVTVNGEGENVPPISVPSQTSVVQDSASAATGSQPSTSSTTAVAKTSSRPPLDYGKMPLPRLKQLEKAKDASIGWILQQIDGVEIKLKEKQREIERRKDATVAI